ncbi:protein of unknown function [Candidatus Methylocalor cossyra]|uniref:Uncharacterized protein n=1 Tax=Candidatus Methylocalor cossyra TaxID=3108543 RepID=A0ABP1C9F5_9GAMM
MRPLGVGQRHALAPGAVGKATGAFTSTGLRRWSAVSRFVYVTYIRTTPKKSCGRRFWNPSSHANTGSRSGMNANGIRGRPGG